MHSTECENYLNSGFSKFRPLSELLSCVDVGVVSPFEGFFQEIQLICREGGSATSLFPVQCNSWLRIDVRFWKKQNQKCKMSES